jgi:hypothetical protein
MERLHTRVLRKEAADDAEVLGTSCRSMQNEVPQLRSHVLLQFRSSAVPQFRSPSCSFVPSYSLRAKRAPSLVFDVPRFRGSAVFTCQPGKLCVRAVRRAGEAPASPMTVRWSLNPCVTRNGERRADYRTSPPLFSGAIIPERPQLIADS